LLSGNKYGASMLLVLMALAIGIIGGGKGTAGPVEPQQHAGASRERGRLACRQGTVYLAKNKDAIEYQVRCKPAQAPERVGVSVSVARNGDHVGHITAFRQRPLLVEKSSDLQYGHCSRDRHNSAGALNCQGRAKRSILLKGRIWVEHNDVCNVNITLSTAPKQKPCDGVCAADYIVVVLASGPPRGC
jgi:hypothetical protein